MATLPLPVRYLLSFSLSLFLVCAGWNERARVCAKIHATEAGWVVTCRSLEPLQNLSLRGGGLHGLRGRHSARKSLIKSLSLTVCAREERRILGHAWKSSMGKIPLCQHGRWTPPHTQPWKRVLLHLACTWKSSGLLEKRGGIPPKSSERQSPRPFPKMSYAASMQNTRAEIMAAQRARASRRGRAHLTSPMV